MTILLATQIILIIFVLVASGNTWRIASILFQLLSLAAAMYVINRGDSVPFKLTWVVIILIFPVFGGVLYMWSRISSLSLARKLHILDSKSRRLFQPNEDVLHLVPEECVPQARYLQEYAGFPVYKDTYTKYLSPGEKFLEVLIPELERAEKYIFLEFFIVQNGKMWSSVLDVLKRKAAEGVDVRLIYDDVGCFWRLPKDYPAELRTYGIKCHVFNPFRPLLSAVQNNRDHRKIISIDGKVAFTGGVNLADEYINEIELYGHWKDCGVMLKGEAAWSFTVIFLEMWHLLDNTHDDIESMRPEKNSCPACTGGFAQPYSDSPMDSEHVGANVFLGIITRAKRYLYINTPYLIVNDSLLNALILAAKSGTDVKIVMPHHADKPLVHATTRSYYRELLQGGVKIYEYTNGFLHSKTVVSDDVTAIIGTTNFDYRSLYLHFECGVVMFESSAVKELYDDFTDMLPACHEITDKDCRKNIFGGLWQSVIRLFAPLM